MTQQALVLVAGGTGERTKKSIPKQFVEINHKPVLIYSLESFFNYNANILSVIVCHKDYVQHCRNLVNQYFDNDKKIFIVEGGSTRFHSVKQGLEYLKKLNFNGIVGVHDAARPCISSSLIKRCFDTAKKYNTAVPVVPLSESIRKIKEHYSVITNRNDFVIVQTPQCADFSIIYNAFQMPYQPIFTDEANVLETAGEKIYMCEGDKNNIKITYPIDFDIASLILQNFCHE